MLERIGWGAVWMVALTAAAAAEPVEEPIGPGDAVRIALEQNPTVVVAELDVRIAEADRQVAGGGYLPRIEFTEDWVRSDNPVFVFSSKLLQGVFSPQDFDVNSLNSPDPITNSTAQISIYQNIWNGGAVPQRKAAAAGIAAAEAAQEKTRDVVVFGALKAYWDLVLADEMLRVTTDAERAAEANLDLAGVRQDSGLAVPSDRMRAEVRLADVRAMSIRAASGVEVAQAALRRALGEERPSVRYVPVQVDTRPAAAEDSLEVRLASALAERSDLKELDRRIEQARIGTKAARSGYYPQIGAVGAYQWNGEQFLAADAENWAIGLAIRFTIFDGNGTQGRSRRARAEVSKLEATRLLLAQGIRLEVASAWAERDSARQRLVVAESALSLAEEALRIVRDRYAEGMTLIVELLNAESALTQAQARYAAAISELWLAHAGLDLASGVDPLTDQPA